VIQYVKLNIDLAEFGEYANDHWKQEAFKKVVDALFIWHTITMRFPAVNMEATYNQRWFAKF